LNGLMIASIFFMIALSERTRLLHQGPADANLCGSGNWPWQDADERHYQGHHA